MGTEHRFTFAVVGRNEAPTLAGMLDLARRATHPGDKVWFVDSASTDGSSAIAQCLGVEVIEAPAGKGRAIAAALARCETRYLCLLDADFYEWSINIPAALREQTVRSGAGLVLGAWADGRVRVTAPMLYWPLVRGLFPDYPALGCGRAWTEVPLSGQRVIDTRVPLENLPPGFGIEAHVNLCFAAAGRPITSCELGIARTPVRHRQSGNVSADVVRAILDFAVAHRRLDPGLRPRWERWAGATVTALGGRPGPEESDEAFRAHLTRLAARPLPPTGLPGRPAASR